MINAFTDELIALSDVPARIKMGRPVHRTTIRYWVDHGVHGVKLEAVPVGASLHTTEEALRVFFQSIQAVRQGKPIPSRSAVAVQAATEAAGAQLRREGFK